MTKLIALIDGSVYARSVCDHAAWIAARMHSQIEVVHVLGRRALPSAPANLSGNIGLGARTALLEELAENDARNARLAQKRGRAILDDARAHLTDAGVETVTTRMRHSDIVEAIDEAEPPADLIVIGKRGEAADFARLHLGSNMERVVRSSHTAVLVASRAFKPVERFLIAFDGGPSALKAVEHIARNPVFADLACRIVTVGADTPPARARLEGAAATLREAGYSVEASILPGQPDAVISKMTESGEVDLLVMGAYGHSRIRSLIIGSTTTEMMRRCKIPVLLFR